MEQFYVFLPSFIYVYIYVYMSMQLTIKKGVGFGSNVSFTFKSPISIRFGIIVWARKVDNLLTIMK